MWQILLFGLPAGFLVAAFWFGAKGAASAIAWRPIGLLLAAWIGLMLWLLASEMTRVHGPDPSFLGLIIVTPLIAGVFGFGRWINRKA